ncbi:MAG: tetratricopeptide repeat protein [Gammaproteobacteria bacterium]|nr:tetratricopeptide repeat protein [Gammaproteobacteria bacterium]
MHRLILILAVVTLNACSANYMDRGIPAPIESRDGSTAVTPTPRVGRVMPGPAPTTPEQDVAARTFPAQGGVPSIDDVTPRGLPAPAITYPPVTSSTGQPISTPNSTFRDLTPPAPAPQDGRPIVPVYTQPQQAGTPASALLASVDAAIAEGELERAAALAERALRISPRDAYLWYRLADIRYQQERYSDAAGFAQRALSFAGSDRELTREINGLLARANDAAR